MSAPSAERPRWGMGDAALGIVVGVLLSSVVASAWLAASGGTDLSLGGQALSEIGLWVGLVGAPLWASWRKGAGRLSEDFGLRLRAPDLAVGVVVGVLGQALLVPVVAFLVSPLVGHPDTSGPVNDLVSGAHGVGLAGVVAFVVLGAPMVEELFFRGLVLRSLQRRFPDAVAVPVSAVIFGLAHLQALSAGGLLVVVASLTALGVVLALLAARTGRLGPGMVAHAAFNAYTVWFLVVR
ncbi:MAG: lysostaphin resistance A-like protein [Acidimicrobiales bacterium]